MFLSIHFYECLRENFSSLLTTQILFKRKIRLFFFAGDLRNPCFSIPRGTFAVVLTTFITYNLLSLLAAASCDRLDAHLQTH